MKQRVGIYRLALPLALMVGSFEASADIVCGTKVGDEGGTIISWASESNAIYRIEYAPYLSNSVATTPWKTLNSDYPSHGTNTFWMDNGNYALDPLVKRPKDNSFRFYRAVKTGTNLVVPTLVQITSPASNDVLSGQWTVSVLATSAFPIVTHKLYVDGLEMPSSDDGTNYLINTSEWANGPHVLFVTAQVASGLSGWETAPPVTNSQAVSAYVPVLFSNYISQLYFSEPAFGRYDSGPTQTVTAVFGAYSSWTMQIVNQDSNTVRNASGEGHTLRFGWDGKDNGGTAVPAGDYQFFVSAMQTNEPPQDPPPPDPEPGPLPVPGGTNTMTANGEWYPASAQQALRAGYTSYYTQPPPMPPVMADGKWYPWEEIYGPMPLMEVQIPLRMQETYLQSLTQSRATASSMVTTISAMTSPASAQGPGKPPSSSAVGTKGSFGIAYFTFPNSPTYQNPGNGQPSPATQKIRFDNVSGTSTKLTNVPVFTQTANGFVTAMRNAGWSMAFNKSDSNLSYLDLVRSDLLGGSNLFNQVDLGLFMDHGNFGTGPTPDYSSGANGSYETYFGVGSQTDKWIRMSDFRFGNRLKWMAILACNSLQDTCYRSMGNAGVLPIGNITPGITNQLHLLLGCKTYAAVTPTFGATWADKMKGGAKIRQAWFDTGKKEYKNAVREGIFANEVWFKVAGWSATMDDSWKHYPDPNPTNPVTEDVRDQDGRVFPP